MRKALGVLIMAVLILSPCALGSLITGVWWFGFIPLGVAAAVIGLTILAVYLVMGD